MIKAGATQTETLLKQYVAGERVDLLDDYDFPARTITETRQKCLTGEMLGAHEKFIRREAHEKSNLLFLSWLPTDDGVEHRNVLKSKLLPLPPDLSNHQ